MLIVGGNGFVETTYEMSHILRVLSVVSIGKTYVIKDERGSVEYITTLVTSCILSYSLKSGHYNYLYDINRKFYKILVSGRRFPLFHPPLVTITMKEKAITKSPKYSRGTLD